MALKRSPDEQFSDLEIFQRCSDPNRECIDTFRSVVKLSEEVVVKFGIDVTAEEADNQRKAYELLDKSIVRVPELYRYFTRKREGHLTGYIVMEYIHGNINESPNNDEIDKLAQILLYFSSIQSQYPGPLQRGISRGLLWQESGTPFFQTVKAMETWLNVRLPDVDVKSRLTLQKFPLVFCHLDVAPRNIIWLGDGSVCLLDWASAGFYPRLFEVCLLRIMEYAHGNYEVTLIERMEQLSKDEEAQMMLLRRSFYNGIRWSFPSLRGGSG